MLDDGDEDSFLRSSLTDRQSHDYTINDSMGIYPAALDVVGLGPSQSLRINYAGAQRRVSQPPPAHSQNPVPSPLSSSSHHPRKSNSARAATNGTENQDMNGMIGKPLIFSAMASVRQSPIPPAQTPHTVQRLEQYTTDRRLSLSIPHDAQPSKNTNSGQIFKQPLLDAAKSAQLRSIPQSSYPSPPADSDPRIRIPMGKEIPRMQDSVPNGKGSLQNLNNSTPSAFTSNAVATTNSRASPAPNSHQRRQLPHPPQPQPTQRPVSSKHVLQKPQPPPIVTKVSQIERNLPPRPLPTKSATKHSKTSGIG